MEKPEVAAESPADFFSTDRGERALYAGAELDTDVTLPLTRDGFEAMVERACGVYQLPVDDSTRKVLAGYIHHIANEVNTVTLRGIAKVLHKSITNSLTWMIDQEIKAKAQARFQEAQAQAKAKAEEEAKAAAIAKREIKQAKKAGRRMTVKQKPNETEMS